MQEHSNVIVMQGAVALRDTLICELASHGFAVRSCGSLTGFRHLNRVCPASLAVLAGPVDFLETNVAAVHQETPDATVIALGAEEGASWRMRIMRAGADACHSASIDIGELTAILNAWKRRIVPQDAGGAGQGMGFSSDGWSLSVSRRMLACPSGRILELTRAEIGFLQRLVGDHGQLLRRSEQASSTPSSPPLVARNVDVLVSRLRRKARQHGMELPLMAVHGCGYLFAERLDIEIAEASQGQGGGRAGRMVRRRQ